MVIFLRIQGHDIGTLVPPWNWVDFNIEEIMGHLLGLGIVIMLVKNLLPHLHSIIIIYPIKVTSMWLQDSTGWSGMVPPRGCPTRRKGFPQILYVHQNVCHNSLLRLFSLRLMKPPPMITQEEGVEVWGQKINVDDFISCFSQPLSSL